jgi:hypothetical protein
MTKFNFSKVIKISASEVKKIAIRGDQNTPYAKALQLKPGEGFVVYGKQAVDLCLPYQQASKLGMKFIARSNYKLGEKRGTLVYRIK